MTPHTQRIKHDPKNGQWGDCYQTAIACLLDMDPEDVPHFMHGDSENAYKKTSEWLRGRGYNRFTMPYFTYNIQLILDIMKVNNENIYYFIQGKSSVGANHIFIGLNDKIVHDPSGRNETPYGPCDEGYYWVEVLVPLQVCAK